MTDKETLVYKIYLTIFKDPVQADVPGSRDGGEASLPARALVAIIDDT